MPSEDCALSCACYFELGAGWEVPLRAIMYARPYPIQTCTAPAALDGMTDPAVGTKSLKRKKVAIRVPPGTGNTASRTQQSTVASSSTPKDYHTRATSHCSSLHASGILAIPSYPYLNQCRATIRRARSSRPSRAEAVRVCASSGE